MEEKVEKKQLTKKSKDISKWYLDVISLADLADYSPVKGCMIIKPYGYYIWENIQKIFDKWIREDGVENMYFPLFIPYSFLEKEKTHVKGFRPELAIVTIGGGEELPEPLVVRPTSETIMYASFSKWLKSYKDLPFKVNQWCNVVRWEKRTYPFLRTTEFLWQEGHTAHLTEEEAEEMVLKALGWYRKLYEEYFAISPFVGLKSEAEKFAGAKRTYTVELVIENGKALQGATSHNLGQNFAKAFGIQVLNEKNELVYVWQTSWGLSTRSIGGLILSHGDDNGLVLPPKLAPIQIIILPILDGKEEQKIKNLIEKISKILQENSIRFEIDYSEKTLGWKRNYWEVKGVPLRIEIGKNESKKNKITIVKRTDLSKQKLTLEAFEKQIQKILSDIQNELYKKSIKTREKLVKEVDSKQELIKAIEEKKLVKAYWCGKPECEADIKEKTKATSRVLPLDKFSKKANEKCVWCNNKADHKWIIGRAY